MEVYVLLGTVIAGVLLFCCVFSARCKNKHDDRYRQMCREKREVEEKEHGRESVLMK